MRSVHLVTTTPAAMKTTPATASLIDVAGDDPPNSVYDLYQAPDFETWLASDGKLGASPEEIATYARKAPFFGPLYMELVNVAMENGRSAKTITDAQEGNEILRIRRGYKQAYSDE